MNRAVIVTGRLVQDHEFLYPFYRLQEAGYEVEVATTDGKPCTGIIGVKIEPQKRTVDLRVDDYDLLVIPGGVKCMEHLRLDTIAVDFVRDFHRAGKVVAAICSGTQMLISAGLCRGRVISGYPAIQVDIENAGAQYHDAAVSYERIITAPHYRNLGAWMAMVLMAMSWN